MSRDKRFEPVAPAPAPASTPPAAEYGIQQAMELMRRLPKDLRTTDIVVQVVKRTLESAHISLGSIIADANRREEQIETRIRALQEEIATRQREIEARSAEITQLQTELDDVSRVIERLSP